MFIRHGFIKAAAVTPKIKVADPAYNAEISCGKIEESWAEGARIIVFPELCLTGYTCGDLFLQQALLEEAKCQLFAVAKATEGKKGLIMVGLPLERNGKLYNVAAVLCDGHILGLVPKANIPFYAEFYEGRHFTEGNRDVVSYRIGGETVYFGINILFCCDELPELTVGKDEYRELLVKSASARLWLDQVEAL